MNFEKFFKAIDVLTGVREIVSTRSETPPNEGSATTPAQANFGGQLEKTLTNVLVAALKEAFDRDHARLELERAHLEEQKRRAEEAARAEMKRQAIDRELGRLRLLAATSLVGWIVSVVILGVRLHQLSTPSMIVLGLGCLSLLAALGTSFTAQARMNIHTDVQQTPSVTVVWLLIAGLALAAVSLLV